MYTSFFLTHCLPQTSESIPSRHCCVQPLTMKVKWAVTVKWFGQSLHAFGDKLYFAWNIPEQKWIPKKHHVCPKLHPNVQGTLRQGLLQLARPIAVSLMGNMCSTLWERMCCPCKSLQVHGSRRLFGKFCSVVFEPRSPTYCPFSVSCYLDPNCANYWPFCIFGVFLGQVVEL